MRYTRSIAFWFLIACSAYSMEPVTNPDDTDQRVALGGAHSAVESFSLIPLYDSLNELRLLMTAVVDGIVVRDHAVLLPGRAHTIPLSVAGEWINRAIDLSSEQVDKGQEIVESQDTILRECQKAQKRLWEFVCCFDLLESGTDHAAYKEMLHSNRMLRITSLVTQNEEILKEAGRAPVKLEPYAVEHQHDMHAQFLLSQVSLMPEVPSQDKKSRNCFLFLCKKTHKK